MLYSEFARSGLHIYQNTTSIKGREREKKNTQKKTKGRPYWA
jgi:hypothetical protein